MFFSSPADPTMLAAIRACPGLTSGLGNLKEVGANPGGRFLPLRTGLPAWGPACLPSAAYTCGQQAQPCVGPDFMGRVPSRALKRLYGYLAAGHAAARLI